MNVMTLIEQHPLLRADLYAYGLPNSTVTDVAHAISEQLGGAHNNLCHVLAQLSTREFVRRVDTRQLAEGTDLHPPLAQSIVLTLAPWVGQFKVGCN